MKYMITWSFSADKFLPGCKGWGALSPQEQADVGEGVKLIGRWFDVVGRGGVVILESDDLSAVARYCGRWNTLVDFVIKPVIGDEEAGVVCREITAYHNA